MKCPKISEGVVGMAEPPQESLDGSFVGGNLLNGSASFRSNMDGCLYVVLS